MAIPKVRPAPQVPNGFVASAARLPAVRPNRATSAQSWVGEAWGYYDTIGELRFVANWVGNVMSRAVMRAVENVDGSWVVVKNGPAADAVDAYFGNEQGRSDMLTSTGINLTVPGECYHVYLADEQSWYVLTSGQVTADAMGLTARISNERIKLTSRDLAIRIWTPHPVDPWRADSPVAASISTLSEIKRLNEHVAAQLDSRLAGAGLLLLPSEIQFPRPESADPNSSDADVFMSTLGEAMMTPIKDRSSASAVVPIVVTAPGDMLDKVQHLTFWTALDEAAISMRTAAIKRLALGLDTPPEVLLGIGDTNHWNAWMIDEANIKSHLEPRLQVVANAMTTAYLRPVLKGMVDDPSRFAVMADTSQIRLRPNRSAEAIELYDRGELSGDALRRETGFQINDAPNADEFQRWLLKKVAAGSTSPEQSADALSYLGVDVSSEGKGQQQPDHMRTDSKRVLRDIRIDRPALDNAALMAASEVLVFRALERAGNRLNNKKHELTEIAAHERYKYATGNPDTLLDGSWNTAIEVLSSFTNEPEKVVSILDFYVRGLLATQHEHSPDVLRQLFEAQATTL